MLDLMCQDGHYQLCNHARVLGAFSDDLEVNGAFEQFLEDAYDQLFRHRGYIYAPQRKPLDFPGRASFRHIFFLRDPRDVLVSGYHSFAFSHKPPPQPAAAAAFHERQKLFQQMGIERYAREKCDEWIKPMFASYRKLRETSETNIYISYDEYREDPSNVLDRIANYLGVSIDPVVRDEIARRAAPVSQQVKDGLHKRSGRSGQFRAELSAETQDFLNNRLAEDLAYWKFPAS